MPLRRDQDIHASAPLKQLRSGQWRSMVPLLQRETGRRALRIGVADDDAVPPLPDMAWTRLWLEQGDYLGDLRGRADEPLPFLDEAFDLVWLQHVLEPAPQVEPLLGEACRVLAAGGVLAVTAVHPLGGWAPWFCWRARGQHQTLQWPWRLRQRLQREGLSIEGVHRLGAPWPVDTQTAGGDSRWGGAYLLLARKRRRQATPLKLRPLPARAPVNARLSPGTRRHSVS